jgi:hypothetical protein
MGQSGQTDPRLGLTAGQDQAAEAGCSHGNVRMIARELQLRSGTPRDAAPTTHLLEVKEMEVTEGKV